MAYLDYPGLAYFKSLLDQTYLRVDYDGDTIIAGHVTFTNPITGDIDGRAKKDWLGQQFDTTYLKDIQPDESGALKLILGNGEVSHLVTDTTVTQERSSANETYPVLLCYDENATADQIAKKVKYGHDVQINPAYGYIYAQGYMEKHPTYNRTTAQSSRAEWMLDFRDSVLNPVGQIYSYIDPSGQGGEHRMEFRLYGNPHTTSLNLPNYNFETDTVSLGVSSTKGDKLTFFGYAPSTPIYLENGSTLRKSTIRGDQYGRDIITRDWLNLNGSITGLVHTYMDETIDGYKTFLKTVTIDSGNDNAKAGLNVQGDVNIDSGDASKPSNLYVQGNSHIHGNEDIDGNLNVDGTSDQHGNVHMYHNLDVDGNANTDGNQTIGGTLTVTGKITGNGGAEISGGSGLKVNGNETVTGNLTVGGTINKVSGNTTQEYVTYVTSQPATREAISQNLLALGKGLAKDNQGKIYVDFSQIDDDTKASILSGLSMQIPLKSNLTVVVNPGADNDTDNQNLAYTIRVNTPFTTINGAVRWVSENLAMGVHSVFIKVAAGTYRETVRLLETNSSSGLVSIESLSGNKDVIIESVKVANKNYYDHCVVASSGACTWRLRHIVFKMHITDNNDTYGHAQGCVCAGTAGAIIYLNGNNYQTILDNATVSGEHFGIRMISADNGGTIILQGDSLQSSISAALPTTIVNSFVLDVLNTSRGGVINFTTCADNTEAQYNVSGSCSNFITAWQSGVTTRTGPGPHLRFVGTMTGKKYNAQTGGHIIASDTEFPGDTAGTVDSSTYCWYA